MSKCEVCGNKILGEEMTVEENDKIKTTCEFCYQEKVGLDPDIEAITINDNIDHNFDLEDVEEDEFLEEFCE